MEKNSLRALQLKELEVLQEVDRICKKYNIPYFLTWGTALGAVRHGGFIPWDDDIDISMYWKDYQRFEKLCKSELSNKYFFQSWKSDQGHFQGWNKIRVNNTTSLPENMRHIKAHWGVCIDIFPIIDVPDTTLEKEKQQRMINHFNRLLEIKYLKLNKHKPDKIHKRIVFNLLSYSLISTLLNIVLKQITKFKSNIQCGELITEGYHTTYFDKAMFGSGAVFQFEKQNYLIPYEYDRYLKILYDDYMTFPEVSERTGHGDIIIDLESDYSKYLF